MQLKDKNINIPGSVIAADTDSTLTPRPVYSAVSRVLNFVFSLLVIVIGLPIWLLIMLVIFLDDPKGSPFYVQERVKQGGERFHILKFRSMRVGAEKELDALRALDETDGPVFKIADDPRVTRFGRFLRKYNIDEFPQFINVLFGDMNIVGPRPPLPAEVAQYNSYHWKRLAVKPGLTCYWQIQPNRHAMKFDDWVALDLQYIERRSLLVDAQIILKTVRVIILGDGE